MVKRYLLLSMCLASVLNINIAGATKTELALMFLNRMRHEILHIKRHPLMVMTNQNNQAILPIACEKAFKQSLSDLLVFKKDLSRDKKALLAKLSCKLDSQVKYDLENILTQVTVLETEVGIKINLLKQDARYQAIKDHCEHPDWSRVN